MMRRIRYSVASSLDGFIAGPKGQFDWIPMDPQIDFEAMYAEFDTVLMGRHSFKVAGETPWAGKRTVVVSRTLRPEKFPDVTIWSDRLRQRLTALREEPGKDIWLFGGGELFASLLSMELVDTVEVGLIPALLGSGIPLFTSKFKHVPLKLTRRQALDSGILLLAYDIQYPRPAKTEAKKKSPKKTASKTARGRKRRS